LAPLESKINEVTLLSNKIQTDSDRTQRFSTVLLISIVLTFNLQHEHRLFCFKKNSLKKREVTYWAWPQDLVPLALAPSKSDSNAAAVNGVQLFKTSSQPEEMSRSESL
jgi:hypothetical protein